MRAYLGYCLAAFCCLLLMACGGGGKDEPVAAGEAAPALTKFTITVDTPTELLTAKTTGWGVISSAYAEAQANLNEGSFAAVWLDSKGKILERIDIASWQNLGNGTYVIEAGTRLRVNAVLLIDQSPTPDITVTIGDAIPSHLYMAPLVEERIAVSLKSSLAYYALTQRIQIDESWGIFEEIFSNPSRSKLFLFQQDLNAIADDFEATLLPKVGLENMRLSNLISLSIVQSMTAGRMERFVTEQAAAEANVQAILNDGYWKVGSFSSNSGSGILAEQMVYDGQEAEIGETTITEYRWDKNGAEDISLSEVFTYLSGSTSFGSDDITHQVLTSDGWVGLFDYLKVEVATAKTLLLTDAALSKEDETGITMNASVYPLSGKKIHDYLSGKDNHYVTRYVQPEATFEDGAFGFYFTWRPENERYLLCDNSNNNTDCRISPVLLPDTGYTDLDSVLTDPSDAASNIDNINGFKVADNVVVEFITDNVFTARYWVNIAGDSWSVQEVSTWAPINISDKAMLRFEVPAVIKQLSDNYPFEQQNLFLVEDRGFVHIGESLLDNDTFHFSGFDNVAKEQIFAATSRENLPPFGVCNFGDGFGTNLSKFLNAVTECGGDERFTSQSANALVDQHLIQISEQGDISAMILRSNNSWEQYNNTALVPGNRQWALSDEGYLQLTPNSSDADRFDYWSLTSLDRNRGILALKVYSANSETGNQISTLLTKQYAPDQLAACTTQNSGWAQPSATPVTKKTLAQYQEQVALCKVIWEQRNPRFTESLLIGQTGNTSDDKALRFAGDSSRFLKLSDNFEGDFFTGNYIHEGGCKFNIPIRWKLENDGTLYYEAVDGSLNERIAMTDTDGFRFAIKGFNHQTRWQEDANLQFAADDGEMWSDIISLISASSVPNVTHQELLDNPEIPEEGPIAGTVLNDGLECAPPAPPPQPAP
ncbi:hydrogenase expression protein HypA [Photobacterium proteolyticum]|nr:hydrogenase expression protein HypA [Photobacterium proteolyticum]